MEATTLETYSSDVCNRYIGDYPPKVNTVPRNYVHLENLSGQLWYCPNTKQLKTSK